MGYRAPLLIWTLIIAIGAAASGRVSQLEYRRASLAVTPARALNVAERLAKARIEPADQGPAAQYALSKASNLPTATLFAAPAPKTTEPTAATWTPPRVESPGDFGMTTISAPDGATKLLRSAMERPAPRPVKSIALAALESASPTRSIALGTPPAYGALEADVFEPRRLTILQLGDSHTAADFFSGRVRERLQQVFGLGGDALIVPGQPHLGVRSALFESVASEGWNYEALQRSDARKRFYLSGFNAVAHRAGAALGLRSRGGRSYDRIEVAFLKQPGGGHAQVLLDGAPSGEINLDGAPDERATLALKPPDGHGFREISVKSTSDAPVTVTGVQVGREGDGVSYMSLGFPGATVQLLQKLSNENMAEDIKHIAPDVVVLAFGTNEGFNDNLDIPSYIASYEQIVKRIIDARPGLRVVIVGPPDAARPNGQGHCAGVGQDCGAVNAQISAGEGGGQCRLPVPPKLNLVREAQRKLAQRMGVDFWDWSSAQPGPCGAQVWAAANPPLMARDFVHMTLEGYKQSADRFADFLIPLIEGRPTNAHVVSNN